MRTAEQRQCLYDLKLGMAPGQRRRGEETDVLERIRRSGASGYWVPEARVEHCARKDMQTTDYIAGYFRSSGETAAFLEGKDPVGKGWFGVPRWAWRRLIESWLKYQLHRRISAPKIWLKYLRDYNSVWGAISHWRGSRGRE